MNRTLYIHDCAFLCIQLCRYVFMYKCEGVWPCRHVVCTSQWLLNADFSVENLDC